MTRMGNFKSVKQQVNVLNQNDLMNMKSESYSTSFKGFNDY